MKETKSNWAAVTDYIKQEKPIEFGRYVSYWFYKTPRRMLHSQSYYKFAAKLIGPGKTVLDVGCNEGLGTYLLSKECGQAKGIDFDADAIQFAKENFANENLTFSEEDVLDSSTSNRYDAVTTFDVIEHIYPENAHLFISSLKQSIHPNGLVIIGTPSLISQQFASEIAKKGHVNIYSPERLEEEMKKHFRFVFMFAANDEVVHTGYLPLAHYLISVGCGVK